MTHLRDPHPRAHSRTARRIALLVGVPVAGVLIGGTAAVAFWTVTGTGSGAAQSDTMVAPTVVAGTASGTALYPGLVANGATAGGDLAVKVTNPNAFRMTVTLTQSGQPTACDTPSISLLTTPALSVTVEPGQTVSRTFTKVVSMGAGAGDNCQGKTLSIPLATSAQSG